MNAARAPTPAWVLRQFPSSYRPPLRRAAIGRPPPRADATPEAPQPGLELRQEIMRLFATALECPSTESYRVFVHKSLPDFAVLVDALRMVSAPSVDPSEMLRSAIDRIDEWGGEHRADTFEHAWVLLEQAWRTVGTFLDVETGPEDVELAQKWCYSNVLFTWSAGLAGELTENSLFGGHLVDAVFEDLLFAARLAGLAAREGHELHFPTAELAG